MTVFSYPVPSPVFPSVNPGLSQQVKPVTASVVVTSISGRETRSAKQIYPVWEFDVPFEIFRDQTQNATPDPYYANFTEFQQIVGLFLACKGQYGRFLYAYPEDNSRVGQRIGTGDGTTTHFRGVRTIGTGTLAYTEPVGAINFNLPYKVYINAVDDTVNWHFSSDALFFVRTSPPLTGQVITADFSFWYFCRFLEDIEDYEQFYHHLWSLKSCKFRSVKSGGGMIAGGGGTIFGGGIAVTSVGGSPVPSFSPLPP